MRTVKTLATVAIAMVTLDLLWLGWLAAPLYNEALGALRANEVVVIAAALFYVQYIAVIVWFAVLPSATLSQAARRGAFVGWLAYATYELTNWAVIADWPAHIVPIDIAWGVCLTTALAAIGHKVAGPDKLTTR